MDEAGEPVETDRSGGPEPTSPGREPTQDHALRSMPLRVLICDDHELVRRGLVSYLATEPDMAVVGEAATGEEAVRLVDTLEPPPDVVLMDLLLPGIGGVEATQRIRARHPETHVVVLTSMVTDEQVVPALQAGATSYLLKASSAEELAQALRFAAKGRSTLDPGIAASVVRMLPTAATSAAVGLSGAQGGQTRDVAAGPEAFTPRELEVLRRVAQGRSNQEIADDLGIGVKTVKTHVSSLLGKLSLYDRTQLAVWALTHGIQPGGGDDRSSMT